MPGPDPDRRRGAACPRRRRAGGGARDERGGPRPAVPARCRGLPAVRRRRSARPGRSRRSWRSSTASLVVGATDDEVATPRRTRDVRWPRPARATSPRCSPPAPTPARPSRPPAPRRPWRGSGSSPPAGSEGSTAPDRAGAWDVSADLAEMARSPVCVVSAGPKAILDVPATAEVLESLGVPVVGWRTEELPAFWSPVERGPARAPRRNGGRRGPDPPRTLVRPPPGRGSAPRRPATRIHRARGGRAGHRDRRVRGSVPGDRGSGPDAARPRRGRAGHRRADAARQPGPPRGEREGRGAVAVCLAASLAERKIA